MAWGHRTASEEPLRKSGLATASYFARCERARCQTFGGCDLVPLRRHARCTDAPSARALRRSAVAPRQRAVTSHELTTVLGIWCRVGSGWPQRGSELNWYGGIQAMDARAEPTKKPEARCMVRRHRLGWAAPILAGGNHRGIRRDIARTGRHFGARSDTR